MRKRKKRERKFVDLLIIMVLLLAAYFAIFGGEFTVFRLNELEALAEQRAAELSATQARIDSLQTLADRLRNDPQEIERVARERYGMIRDGEILYRFQDAGTGEEAPEEETSPDE